MQHSFFHTMQTTNWAMASNIVLEKPKERDRTKRSPCPDRRKNNNCIGESLFTLFALLAHNHYLMRLIK